MMLSSLINQNLTILRAASLEQPHGHSEFLTVNGLGLKLQEMPLNHSPLDSLAFTFVLTSVSLAYLSINGYT